MCVFNLGGVAGCARAVTSFWELRGRASVAITAIWQLPRLVQHTAACAVYTGARLVVLVVNGVGLKSLLGKSDKPPLGIEPRTFSLQD